MPDSVAITIAATTMEGLDAVDPQVTVDIIQIHPFNQTVSRQIIHSFNGKATIAVPTPDGVPTWLVNISFSKYDAVSGFFFSTAREPVSNIHNEIDAFASSVEARIHPIRYARCTAVSYAQKHCCGEYECGPEGVGRRWEI